MFYEEFVSSVPSPTIFIHGNLGSNHWWYPAMDQLRELGGGKFHHPSYLVEFRGCGRSDFVLSKGETYSFDKVVDDLVSFIEENFFKTSGVSVNIVGHSTGGFISMLLASKYPHLVRKIILVDPVGPKGLTFGDELYQIYEEMKTDLNLVEKVIRKTVARKSNIDPILWKEICLMVQLAVGRLGAGIPRALRGVDLVQQFSAISAETLIIHGEKDSLIDVSTSEELKSILPNSRLRILSNLGHSPNIEDPAQFAYLVGEFLRTDTLR